MSFMQQIKPLTTIGALLLAAAVGAFVSLKIAVDPEFSDIVTQRKIEARITEKISRIRATQGDILELVVLESVLTFEQNDEWTNVPARLGKSTVSLSVPAIFRFFVKISEPISVRVQAADANNDSLHCVVIAPLLRPELPVAFDTSRVVRKSEVGALRFNREEIADTLREKISMRLVLSAKKHAKSPAVRDAARGAFKSFVENWLGELRGLRIRPDTKISVDVIFADEVPAEEDDAAESALPEKITPVPVSV